MGEMTEVIPPTGVINIRFCFGDMRQSEFNTFKENATILKYAQMFAIAIKGETIFTSSLLAYNAGLGLDWVFFTDSDLEGVTLHFTNEDLKVALTGNSQLIKDYVEKTYGFHDWDIIG
ncbi:MAG: hypothetical protein HDR80_01130 [Bacteroides sp.]|nr:hypothetical protein [Bacteroides sp.]